MSMTIGTRITSQANNLNGPIGIVIDCNANIYLADRNNQRILYLSNNTSSISIIAGITSNTLTSVNVYETI